MGLLLLIGERKNWKFLPHNPKRKSMVEKYHEDKEIASEMETTISSVIISVARLCKRHEVITIIFLLNFGNVGHSGNIFYHL